MKIKKNCIKCQKEFEVYPSLDRVKYCSISCSKKGKQSWNKGLKGYKAGETHYRYGKKCSDELKKKMSTGRKGITADENHPQWKGEKVGYRALHNWVENNLGKPMHCSFCNETQNKRYHWANISGNYYRNKFDWIRLCPKCHRGYDKNKKSPALTFEYKNAHYAERRIVE